MLNMSERGKLGAKAARKTINEQKKKRIEDYNKNPIKCKQCQTPIPYEKKNGNKFCNSSCSAKYTNTRRKKKPRKKCLYCSKEINSDNIKYCSQKCQMDQQYYNMVDDYKSGKRDKLSRKGVKRFLVERDGEGCYNCGITSWQGKEIVLETEHIDGNSDNNSEENLCLLCPNCHSQTPTYKGRNIGNGRHSRRVRYREGKSY